MRVLLDNCTPRGLASFLHKHAVEECRSRGWDKRSNGDLLDAAEAAGFGVFITTDQNIRQQQNLARRRTGIVVLGSNRWRLIRAHAEQIMAAVEQAKRGSLTEIWIAER